MNQIHHLHFSLNRQGRWGITDDFTTSFLHCSLFSTALWDLAKSKPVYSFIFCSHLLVVVVVCLVFFPLSLCLARWFWPDLMNGKHYRTTAVCVSLRSLEGLRVVQLSAGSWHRLPHYHLINEEVRKTRKPEIKTSSLSLSSSIA